MILDSQHSSQFLNIQDLAFTILKQTWDFLKCGLCNNLAANPRQCQTCQVITCFECITNFQQNQVKDPSLCFKGCQYVVFFPINKRDLAFNHYFQSIIDPLELYCEAQLESGLDENMRDDQKNNIFEGFIQNYQKELSSQSKEEGKLIKKQQDVCVLCLKQIEKDNQTNHFRDCSSKYRYCDKCKIFKRKCDSSHICFITETKCMKCDMCSQSQSQNNQSLNLLNEDLKDSGSSSSQRKARLSLIKSKKSLGKHRCTDELKSMMLNMQQDFLITIKKLQQENQEMKSHLRKKADVLFCQGCDKIIVKTDKKVRCVQCKHEFCYSCVGQRLYYCYICMGYVCCEDPKQAQLCDIHITKTREKFGQLLQAEVNSTENPENLQSGLSNNGPQTNNSILISNQNLGQYHRQKQHIIGHQQQIVSNHTFPNNPLYMGSNTNNIGGTAIISSNVNIQGSQVQAQALNQNQFNSSNQQSQIQSHTSSIGQIE